MKKIIYCTVVCCLLFLPPLRLHAQTIMHIESGTYFYMRPGTSVALDSLVLKPSISFAFTNTDIIKSKTITHAATGNYISRVYRFSNPVAQYYSGDIKVGYLDNELNGLNENSLVLQAFTNYKWTAFRKNVSRNTNSNVVTAAGLYRISLNELTLADTLITINTPPAVSITSPANNAVFTAPATITINAEASDTDGIISNVKFYNGTTYLKTVYTGPFTYTLSNLPAGTYSLTAKATDNLGAQTVSAAVTVKVLNASIVSNKPYSENEKTALNDALSLRLAPNPANSIVNILASGLRQNKPASLSIISLSGIVLKTMHITSSMQTMPLDVSSLASGVYTIKIISGNQTIDKKFVKL